MAVNTAALKTFAPAMRRQLMEAVGRKLDLLLNSQTPDTLSTYAKQIAELREEQEKSRDQLLERVAYTWFNRLCALRYLDAKGWHPFGCKVLMPADGSETQPELLKLMRSGSLPVDLQSFTNEQRLNQLLDGQIPTAIPGGDAQGEVYRELVLAACRSYHNLLPDLFEGLDDASELLLPDDLLTEGSIAGSFRSSISDSDCDDVEIIGWLYQFYISEKKDAVIGKVVKSEDIPAATQLFTPNWIVKYMVQNTIGAQWLATYPDSPLREQMEFYIEPAEQTDEVKTKLAEITPISLNPEEITLMDPACGSGHILVEAYEIFKAIYLEQGYQLREIPTLVLEKNLFGLDIDQRAAQLSCFCLLMKGRADNRRLLDRGIKLNVIALKNSSNFNTEELNDQARLSEHDVELNHLIELKRLFENATTFGSLIQAPAGLKEKLSAFMKSRKPNSENLFLAEQLKNFRQLSRQAELLGAQYDAVIANPPYMGGKFYCPILKEFIKRNYINGKSDLYGAFILRNIQLAKRHGSVGMITIPSWMFLSSFKNLRELLRHSCPISTLVHNGRGVWGPDFGSCAFVLQRSLSPKYSGQFLRLFDTQGSVSRNEELRRRFNQKTRRFSTSNSEFEKIPGNPIAYWMTNQVKQIFKDGNALGDLSSPRKGNSTSDNNRFLRLWSEVDLTRAGFNLDGYDNSYRWIPYNKGGGFLKWYGHNNYLIDWKEEGQAIREIPTAVIANEDHFFQPGLTWGTVTVGRFSIRWFGNGFIFDNGGCCVFGAPELRSYILALMNSAILPEVIGSINPTVNFQSGEISKFPVIVNQVIKKTVEDNTNKLLHSAINDWDSYERSWDFQLLPLFSAVPDSPKGLQSSYNTWVAKNMATIAETRKLEEENNRLFINAYGLSDELKPDVPIEQITLTVNPSYRYGGDGTDIEKWERFQRDSMAELLSYATGCIMGRYSLDHPGLILADSRRNQDEQLAAYETIIGKSISEIQFKPDADAIIPVLDGEWFEDDIVARTREFLKVTFPESSVTENLRFIEDSIGKDIRKYFCKDFYKDHLQTYKKRPIYWMVQSPKAGFACLIYLHRYTPDTLLQVLNNYFRPYLQKLEARQEQLERDQNNDALPKREQTAARKEAEKITKVLKECQAWEQDALLPLAQQRIELDLDDGVKVNYLKLQEVLAKIPGLAAKGD